MSPGVQPIKSARCCMSALAVDTEHSDCAEIMPAAWEILTLCDGVRFVLENWVISLLYAGCVTVA